jgi:hypothetical protein
MKMKPGDVFLVSASQRDRKLVPIVEETSLLRVTMPPR